jgi:predicted Ser/Thr protein kinase
MPENYNRPVHIVTDPPGVFIYDHYGRYLGISPDIQLSDIRSQTMLYFIDQSDRFKKETKRGSREGYANNYVIIPAGYFRNHDTYPAGGSIKLIRKKGTTLLLWPGVLLLVIPPLLVLWVFRRRKALAPAMHEEPATVTTHALEGFGGQVGNIRGMRLIGRYGTYLVVRVMGEGGMSMVYEAVREAAEKADGAEKCAVKVVLPSIARSKEYRDRFHREIEVYHRLIHPSIVQIYDWGDEEDVLFIVMEKIEGKPLSDVIREAPPSLKQGVIWTLQTLRALGFAHDRRIVHRDIKPNNIFITPGENVKVLDFGIARALDAKTITATDVALGTPQYLPPEQMDSKTVDHRADLYSLGVMAYQLFAGVLPFQGETTYELLIKQMSEIPAPPTNVNSEVPPALGLVVMKLLQKKPEDRYGTAREAALALGEAAVGAGIIIRGDLEKWLQ